MTGKDLDGLTGIGLIPAMLDHARRRAEDTGRALDASTGDVLRLDFSDGGGERFRLGIVERLAAREPS